MLSVAPWFGTGLTFFRELCYLTVVAFQRQGIKLVRERIRKNPVRSIQCMANDLYISTRSMGRIVKEDLRLECYQFREVQLLSEINKRRRYNKRMILLKRFTGATHQRIVFSDEDFYCRNDVQSSKQ